MSGSDGESAATTRPATLKWEVHITVSGITFTSVECDTKGEAVALKNVVKHADGVKNAEVRTK